VVQPAYSVYSILPAPRHQEAVEREESVPTPAVESLALAPKIPPYGQRKGWAPTSQEDFGDGGAYPEVHKAQYPLELGRKKTVSPFLFLTASRAYEGLLRLAGVEFIRIYACASSRRRRQGPVGCDCQARSSRGEARPDLVQGPRSTCTPDGCECTRAGCHGTTFRGRSQRDGS
jgi:hypothetical protein